MRTLAMQRAAAIVAAVTFLAGCSPATPSTESTDTTTTGSLPTPAATLPPDTPVWSAADSGLAPAAPGPVPAMPEPGAPDGATSAPTPPSGGGSSGSALGAPSGSGAPSNPGLTGSDTSSLQAVIARAESAYRAARTARGTFTQTIVNPQTGTRAQATGTFYRQQPDKFAFQFSDPAGDLVVADGRYVWLYLPSTNPGQVIRSALTSSAGSYDLGSLFFENTRERYTVSDEGQATLDGRATRVLRLTPRSEAPFARATVWIEEGTGVLRQFHVVDGMGVERTVHIRTYTPNVPVPDEVFRFVPPEGVRVVDAESIGR